MKRKQTGQSRSGFQNFALIFLDLAQKGYMRGETGTLIMVCEKIDAAGESAGQRRLGNEPERIPADDGRHKPDYSPEAQGPWQLEGLPD